MKGSRPKTIIPKSSGARPSATKSGDSYCPDAGVFIWIDFDPTKGHEQRGHRLAIVLSPRAYNERAGLCIACPITSRARGFRFEVPIPAGGLVSGGVVLAEVRAKIAALIEIE